VITVSSYAPVAKFDIEKHDGKSGEGYRNGDCRGLSALLGAKRGGVDAVTFSLEETNSFLSDACDAMRVAANFAVGSREGYLRLPDRICL